MVFSATLTITKRTTERKKKKKFTSSQETIGGCELVDMSGVYVVRVGASGYVRGVVRVGASGYVRGVVRVGASGYVRGVVRVGRICIELVWSH